MWKYKLWEEEETIEIIDKVCSDKNKDVKLYDDDFFENMYMLAEQLGWPLHPKFEEPDLTKYNKMPQFSKKDKDGEVFFFNLNKLTFIG